MLKFHSFFFTSWPSFRSYIGEILIIIDASLNVVTLGIVELNVSVLYYELMDRLYGDPPDRDSW